LPPAPDDKWIEAAKKATPAPTIEYFLDTKIKRGEGLGSQYGKVGHWIYYWPNGKKQMEGKYGPGQWTFAAAMAGKWSFWRENGEPLNLESILPQEAGSRLYWVTLKESDGALWISMVSDEEGRQFNHKEYVQRKQDARPIFYYRHDRGITPRLSLSGSKVIISDYPATKARDLYVVDLKTKQRYPVSEKVMKSYQSAVSMENCIVLPTEKGLSPDEKKMLVWVELEYLMNVDGLKDYRDWSYVVDIKSGKVLKVFKTKKIPVAWWN
jgi:hypothetical protein